MSSFGSEYKMEEPPFQSFHKEEIGELYAKVVAIWRRFAVLKDPLSPKLANKLINRQLKMNLVGMEVTMV